ncbi:MAG: histidinol dehydrogenase [Gammaproteobacteria bacterium]|nr:histidinol dehydrogenase [Gammaproteobacteria bacterium]
MNNIRLMYATDPGFEDTLKTLLAHDPQTNRLITEQVSGIIEQIKLRGDSALLEYVCLLDGHPVLHTQDLVIEHAELAQAYQSLPSQIRDSLHFAKERIARFHQKQLEMSGQSWQYEDEFGNKLGQVVRAIESVGIYIPGGKACYPSSVLMNAIPAKIAGVPHIYMMVPTPGGKRNDLVLAAAYLANIDKVFTVGGAHAIAALAFGTQTIPKVDFIAGPGNAYVAEAKRILFGQVGIDMIAGPSEVVILADGSCPTEWVIMDLLAQAEHDEWAQSILVSPSLDYLQEVQEKLPLFLDRLPRKNLIAQSIQNRGALIYVPDFHCAYTIINQNAPEHLEIACENPQQHSQHLDNFGAIFLGAYSSESLGDYCAGPNHVLPTAGTARFSSPLSVLHFQKRSSVIEISTRGATILGEHAHQLALNEGLEAHALAAKMRT